MLVLMLLVVVGCCWCNFCCSTQLLIGVFFAWLPMSFHTPPSLLESIPPFTGFVPLLDSDALKWPETPPSQKQKEKSLIELGYCLDDDAEILDDFDTNPDAWLESGNFPTLIQPNNIAYLYVPETPPYVLEEWDDLYLERHPESAKRVTKIKKERRLDAISCKSLLLENPK